MRTDFIHFSDIDLARPESWKGKKIVSFDVDWAIDEAIEECMQYIANAQVKATFFVTHDSPALHKLKNTSHIELGIHPNFDPLINKQPDSLTSNEIINNLKQLVPSASVIRSHGMTHSGRWLPLYKQHGLKYSSQYFMNGVNTIQPFSHLNGTVEAPVYFADDGFIWEADQSGWDHNLGRFSFTGHPDYLCVYNFHPIHIALNTPGYSFYESTRSAHRDPEQLSAIKNNAKPGAADLLKKLLA
ncbi:MAG TPA: hypothetical protein VGF30_00250 [Bacteroidia bacterium]